MRSSSAALIVLFSIFFYDLFGQLPGLHIKKADGHIEVDAEMNEADLLGAEAAGHFKQLFPFDSSYAWAQ